MRVLLVWTGGVVPAYREFFAALGNRCDLCVLTPRSWVHGSRPFELQRRTPAENFKLKSTGFMRFGSSLYLIPAFPFILIRFHPTHIYFMDEMDRPATFFHLVLALLFAPSAQRINYNLQNLLSPSYTRAWHRFFSHWNRRLLHAGIAAGAEAESVLRDNGFRKAVTCIPLFASTRDFHPLPEGEKAALRLRLGIPENRFVLIHAGSLVKSKGVDMLLRLFPRHPKLFLLLAGAGDLESEAKVLPPDAGRFLGSMDLESLRAAYQCSDAVILASRDTPSWKEQVGRSLLEGMFCGCLGIGSSSGSIPEVLGTPETVFAQGDEPALSSLLGRLPLPDSQRLFEQQQRHVRQNYSAIAVADATVDFLEAP